MPFITLTDTLGQSSDIEFSQGDTLMQTIVNAGASDLLALCGGVCSCATCHVYLDKKASAAADPISEDENELLELSEVRRENSRLSCQIRITEAFDGAAVTIAPSE